MPIAPSYPGVYVEEVPSGVRTITGVPTSITAFVGRALRGPVDSDAASPVRIFSFAEYERIFGGLWNDSPTSFAVWHYFQNGGLEALIVRVHSKAGTGSATIGGSAFHAASRGAWASQLRVRIDTTIDASIAAANPAGTLFNLHVKDLGIGVSESHLNVSMKAGQPRFVSAVLRQNSVLLRGPTRSLATLPTASSAPAASATDPFSDPTSTSFSTGASDGYAVSSRQITAAGLVASKRGIYALEKADLFNVLCIPPFSATADVDKTCWDAAIDYAVKRRAMVLVDPPYNTSGWRSAADVAAAFADASASASVATRNANAALFFPRLMVANPLKGNRLEAFAPCGAVAGLIARTDNARGVWKSPAGLDATLRGLQGLDVNLTDSENGIINKLGVNCLRNFPSAGFTVWGSRTLNGTDSQADPQWRYLAVRRMALFLEESLQRGTQWVVFEPNDEPLWAQIRLNVGAFMQTLFRQGAFLGQSAQDAYFVRCDTTTTTQTDIDNGLVNIVVGFAPLKPAEFVIIKLQQIAGSIPA